jgi:hypothetical protein
MRCAEGFRVMRPISTEGYAAFIAETEEEDTDVNEIIGGDIDIEKET